MSKTIHFLRDASRAERVAFHEDNVTALEAFAVEDAQLLEDWKKEPPFRATDRIENLPANESQALDTMIERFGLARLLKTLRVLCESRTPSPYDLTDTLETVEDSELWQGRANALDALINSTD